MKYGLALLVISLFSCGKKQEPILPVTKPLLEAVYASGFLVSDQEYQLFSQADGNLAEILVKEGEHVKKGEPILIIASAQQSARYSIARETYEQATRNALANVPQTRYRRAHSPTRRPRGATR